MNGYFCFKSTTYLTRGMYIYALDSRTSRPPSLVAGRDRMQFFKVSFHKFRNLQPWFYLV